MNNKKVENQKFLKNLSDQNELLSIEGKIINLKAILRSPTHKYYVSLDWRVTGRGSIELTELVNSSLVKKKAKERLNKFLKEKEKLLKHFSSAKKKQIQKWLDNDKILRMACSDII
jgi:hypothetical protein